ncbi:SpoIIE family protein phosphatase [Blastococcus sp. SYSU D00820]
MPHPDSERVLASMPVGFMAIGADWVITHVNPAGERIARAPSADLVGRSYWSVYPDNAHNEFGHSVRRVMERRTEETFEAFYPAPLFRWFAVQAVPSDSGLFLYFSDVTERRQAQDRLTMLARVGEVLSGALDPAEAARRVPGLVVPALAEGCLVTVVDDDGRPHDLGTWHADPDRREVLHRYAVLRLGVVPATAPVIRSLAGETVVMTGPDVLAGVPSGEVHDLFARLAPRTVVTMPLRGLDRVVGALTLLLGVRDVDLPSARDVADRVGAALDGARVYGQQRRLAEGLQRSLLSDPVEPADAEIAVRYTPAAEAARVGGDWYDAFLQPSGATMLVIGDVVGHDTAAAAAMGQLRSLLRGVAVYSDAGPAEVLRGLDAAMTQLRVQTYATATVARFEQTDAERARGITRMRWSNAGHLPVLVIDPAGSVAPPPGWRSDLLLGLGSPAGRSESVVSLACGSTVLLFTDGLVERRTSDLDAGLALLTEAAGELAGRPLAELCDEVIERLVHGRPDDDVALVAMRLHPAAR